MDRYSSPTSVGCTHLQITGMSTRQWEGRAANLVDGALHHTTIVEVKRRLLLQLLPGSGHTDKGVLTHMHAYQGNP